MALHVVTCGSRCSLSLISYCLEQVWNFIRTMGVPYNKLHEMGYVSIGCEPCTRPVLPNQVREEEEEQGVCEGEHCAWNGCVVAFELILTSMCLIHMLISRLVLENRRALALV